MIVKRIVANIAVDEVGPVRDFYANLFGLSVPMDMCWIATLSGDGSAGAQLSVATEGGSGTDVPDISIEVDDLYIVIDRARNAGVPIVNGPVEEPWGVRRFYLRDPAGKLVNVLTHPP